MILEFIYDRRIWCLVTIIYHGRMTRGGHGLLKVSPRATFNSLYALRASHPINGHLKGGPWHLKDVLWQSSAPLDTPCLMPLSINISPHLDVGQVLAHRRHLKNEAERYCVLT
jgi:hypothetical protein